MYNKTGTDVFGPILTPVHFARHRGRKAMKIALVEDNELHRTQISREIRSYFDEMGEVCELHVFENGSDMLDHYRTVGGYDLLLLDIMLPGMDGVMLAKQIRETDGKVIIVFITSMTAYAVQGYSVRALDYILKPINRISFRNTMDRVRDMVRQRAENFIVVAAGDGLMKLDISQIYYIETEKHAVRLYYTRGSFHINDTMKNLEARLGNAPFCRCNNCYLVNLAHVEQVKKDYVIVAGHELAFSRLRYKPFMDALTRYMGGVRG